MLRLIFLLDTKSTSAEWVKEHIAMTLERWGDIKLEKVEVVEDARGKVQTDRAGLHAGRSG